MFRSNLKAYSNKKIGIKTSLTRGNALFLHEISLCGKKKLNADYTQSYVHRHY